MTPTLFRGMVIATVLFSAAGLALDFSLVPLSPVENTENVQCEMLVKCIAGIGGVVALVVSYFVTVIGLLLFRPWSRPLYLLFICVPLAISAFLGVYEVAAPA